MYNFRWSKAWTNETKPVDHERPFHRINSPTYDERAAPASGRGYDCGCRSPFYDYDADVWQVLLHLILPGPGVLPVVVSSKLLRTMPAWVPVQREISRLPPSRWRNLPEVEHEVEGVLSRSFQTWTDVPLLQWHKWYDWNFHLVPAKGYSYIRGAGNKPHEGQRGGTRPVVQHQGTMECEWDCGAFGDYDYSSPHGKQASPGQPGPMFGKDWAWPMAGQNVWIAGRWIYDCGHASSDEKTGRKPGLMRTELHPCKAVATARWEAVKFDQNDYHAPAIQFMFFACTQGGYKDFATIADRDYEFIVDLPEAPHEAPQHPVGHTPDVPLNTIVLRPRLLMKIDYQPFDNAYGNKARPGQADPVVELLPPAAADQLPKQAKVRIPLTQLGGVDSYGMILSLGWHDPSWEQARKVKIITVVFTHLVRKERHESGDAEWQLKVGVNGRWFATFKEGVHHQTNSIGLGHRAVIYLPEDEYLYINAHGMEEDKVGGVMRERTDERTLKDPNGAPYQWDWDIDQRDQDHASGVARASANKLWVNFNLGRKSFTDENEPLGLIDPGYVLASGDTPNPLRVKELVELCGGENRPLSCKLTARLTRDNDAELSYDPRLRDYTLYYQLSYQNLLP